MNSMLDIGGGEAKFGVTTIDLNSMAEIRHDLNKFPWPVKDSIYSDLRMSHILEHLDNPLRAMEEAYRIARHGAILQVMVPWWERDMFSNPAHRQWFRPVWFRRLHPDDNAWTGEMKGQCRMNWRVLKEKKLRGKRRFWKIYEYHVWLEAVKL
jgi:hypothetical protein